MKYFEKNAYTDMQTKRLAVRLKNMYGWGNTIALKKAKKVSKGLSPSFGELLVSSGFANKGNRTKILQKNLKDASTPTERIFKRK